MECLTELREIIAKELQSQIGNYAVGTMKDTFIQSRDLNRFLVVCYGWDDKTGLYEYGIVQDVEIQADGKVLIHADFTDGDLAEELEDAGVPYDVIIKGYDERTKNRLNKKQNISKPNDNHQRMAA